MMATNPALQLSAIKVKNNAEAVRPFDSVTDEQGKEEIITGEIPLHA